MDPAKTFSPGPAVALDVPSLVINLAMSKKE